MKREKTKRQKILSKKTIENTFTTFRFISITIVIRKNLVKTLFVNVKKVFSSTSTIIDQVLFET